MNAIKRIICPTDLSEDAERTLRYAVALARTYDAKLFVCYRPHAITADVHAEAIGRIRNLVAAVLFAPFDSRIKSSALDYEIVLLDDDDIGAGITREATARGAQLILMRSRRRPLAAALLGSTAEIVARMAPCPVLVTHADEGEWMDQSTGEIALKRILIAHDFSTYSELALQYGLAIAQQFEAEVHLLHVLAGGALEKSELAWVGGKTNTPYHDAARRLHESIPAQVHLWCKVKHAVKTGRPYSEILSYARAEAIDLICMGAHGGDYGPLSVFGSNVDRVLRQARCPVLIAHLLKATEEKLDYAARKSSGSARIIRADGFSFN